MSKKRRTQAVKLKTVLENGEIRIPKDTEVIQRFGFKKGEIEMHRKKGEKPFLFVPFKDDDFDAIIQFSSNPFTIIDTVDEMYCINQNIY